jgi:FkbM family methyltransferase
VDKQAIKQGIVRVMRTAFGLLPRSAVRAAIRQFPRLAVGAPPGIEVRSTAFLGQFTVLLDTSSCVERSMIRGTYEPGNVHVIRSNVRPGDRCIDVGANVGAMAFAMAQAAGPDGRVYAFEPGPPFYERLTRNVSLNPSCAEVIVCENLGVSDTSGTLRWAEDTAELGKGNGGVVTCGGVEIPVTTLDAYAAAKVDGRIAFIKVDVEGWELHVLQGARALLRKHRPVVLLETLPEFDVQQGGRFFTGLRQLFRDCEYDLYGVHASGATFAIQELGVSQMTLARPRQREARADGT